MKQLLFALLFLVSFQSCFSQDFSKKEVDSLYKEDQFFIGVTYNLFGKEPSTLKESGFSLGFHLGVIKDIPLNKNRNLALGIGLGYSVNTFNNNLLIVKNEENKTVYSLLENDNSYSKNRFFNHLVELPIEFRWRTSNPEDYEFWRVYPGFKIGYVFNVLASHKGELGNFSYNNIDDFNKLQYGLTLSAGYNTWNIYAYYGLNNVFSKNTTLNDGREIDVNAIKIGLMFFIL